MLDSNNIKENLGRHAASFVQPGMTVGLGTGSTVYWLIKELGERIKSGLDFTAVPTSRKTEEMATGLGIQVRDLNDVSEIDLTIDGADEINPAGQLIKGGGGALLQEKMVAAASGQLIVIADQSKLVTRLGAFPLPVEVISWGYKQVQANILANLKCNQVELRKDTSGIFITDHQHYILDCHFQTIADPGSLNTALHAIPGVVETGLFINMTSKIIIGYPDGSVDELNIQK